MGIGDVASTGRRKKKKKTRKRKPKQFTPPPGAEEEQQGVTDLSVRPDYRDLDPELLATAEEFAKVYDRLKKLEAKKKELADRLKEAIPTSGIKGRFVPLSDGRKVTTYSSKGQPKIGKGTLVEEFGKKGAELWASAPRGNDYTGVTVKD